LALERLAPVRDRILDLADVKPGEVVLDVGCGDGLVGLAALDRGARVIFSDISEACLQDCRAIAGDGAEYKLASATELGDIQVDVVTTRSVLIYVADKPRAFAEFFRVLRGGGRISVFEPINRFGMEERRKTYGFSDITGVEESLARVIREMDGVEERGGGLDSMIDFDEKDLLALAEDAGFVDLRLELVAEVTREPMWQTRDWEVFLNSSPNPLAPTFREAMDAALSPAQGQRLKEALRPQLEAGQGRTRIARAFLAGSKPTL
jgi:ubiquinone/menaquinone biosynthesis C-methylase UbiE